MDTFAYIKKSIGLMQAALLLIAAIIIGLGLTVWQMHAALNEQRSEISHHATDLLKIASGGAANAAWALDSALAEQIASALLLHDGVNAVEIRADIRGQSERLLARVENNAANADRLVVWVALNYFDEAAYASKNLYISQQGEQMDVGDISIEMDPTWAAKRFLARAESILIVSLLEAFCIGIVLLLLAQWLVTRPLQRAAAKISRINPESLDDSDHSIQIPKMHQTDELGLLLNHTNQLLDRLVESQKELRLLATRDALTGLPNRTLIKEALVNMLANAQRSEHQVAVIFVDLDRFKTVNDSLGHGTGDQLLISVASTLLAEIRDQDMLGRLGGDEFLIIMPINSVNDVVVVVRRIIESMGKTFEIDGIHLRTGASLGIAIYPFDGDNADILMRRADLAMYRAKADTSTQWHLFSEDMSEAVGAGVLFETALAGAISRNELELYLQPIFASGDRRLIGCEALLRWRYEGEWVAPEKFIGVAESSGLIREIGDWALDESCKILSRWNEPSIFVSVNVSARQLADQSFVDRVIQAVERFGIARCRLGIEITETALMHDLEQTRDRLTLLRKAGLKISIDDFGTGYSSLSYLARLPIDELKIDRSFVSGARRSNIILSAIVAMADALGIDVVGEGAETEAQCERLEQSGCDALQGVVLGEPMPVDQFERRFGIGGPAAAGISEAGMRQSR